MATLALPAPAALPVFEPALDFQLTRDLEPAASALSTCLLLNHRSPAPQDPVVLATYKVNLLLQGSSLILRNYTLSELVSPRPYSYLKFTDGLGNDLSDEMYLGRCSADLQISTHLFQQALSLANLAAAMFPVHHQVLPLRGLNATFIFRNYPTGAETAEDTHHVTLFPRGTHALLMEQADSAALSDRMLALQFRHGLRPVGDTITIGRCL